MGHQASCNEKRGRLKRKVEKLTRMLLKTVNEHITSGSYTVKYLLLENIVNHRRGIGMSSILDSSQCTHFNLHITQAYKTTLQRTPTRMYAKVSVIDRSYERTPACGKDSNKRLEQGAKRVARIERCWRYFIRDSITITMDAMA